MKLKISLKGGPGSGNFGHSGRPGVVGGSGGGSGGGSVKTAAKKKVGTGAQSLKRLSPYKKKDLKVIMQYPPAQWESMGLKKPDRMISYKKAVTVNAGDVARWAGGMDAFGDPMTTPHQDAASKMWDVYRAQEPALSEYFGIIYEPVRIGDWAANRFEG